MSQRKIAISLPELGNEEWEALKEPLSTGWLTQGPKVAEFERAFAELHRAKHAIATTSCTTALHLMLAALDVGPGDEVIVPAFTWVATANVVLHCGAQPVFADVDPHSYNLDPAKLAETITAKTKAIIPVHLFGLCADMPAIRKAAGKIPLLEDAACAAGAGAHGEMAGTMGLAGAFSFHPRKVITTGEGGMVTTNDDAFAEKVKCLRNHGASISEEERHRGPKPYLLADFHLPGFNYRMTDLQGAVGLVQLKKLKRFREERQQWAAFYDERLKSLPWASAPRVPEGHTHGWQAYVIRVDESKIGKSRNEIMEALQQKGISVRPGTHSVPHLHYYAKRYGYTPEDFPEAYACERQTMALPLHNKMTPEDYHYVVDTLKAL